MAGRNNRPKKNGPAGHPSQLDQYREEFSVDLTEEKEHNRKDKTRYTM
ncbi:hypothetical protein [Paenibacillus flagellatus]|nr:hypothetical protein [Paenibacillus flagellatus]